MSCRSRSKGRRNKFQVGTSGFMVKKKTWLGLNCLNCIEVNSTFYHLPRRSTIDSWKNMPNRVSVFLKAPETITHRRRLHNVEDDWEEFWERIEPLNTRLAGVLFQTPPSFAYSRENLARIREMHEYLPRGLRVVFEFRHISWFEATVHKAFKRMKWCLGGTYIRKKEGARWMGTMPAGLHLPSRTAPFTYLRIHGSRGYRGSLDRDELREVRDRVRGQGGGKHFVMFNNTFFKKRDETCGRRRIKYAAVCNAIEFSNIS